MHHKYKPGYVMMYKDHTPVIPIDEVVEIISYEIYDLYLVQPIYNLQHPEVYYTEESYLHKIPGAPIMLNGMDHSDELY